MEIHELAELFTKEIGEVKQNQKEHSEKTEERLRCIEGSCTKLVLQQKQDEKIQDDHETRLRKIEKFINRYAPVLGAFLAGITGTISVYAQKLLGGGQ